MSAGILCILMVSEEFSKTGKEISLGMGLVYIVIYLIITCVTLILLAWVLKTTAAYHIQLVHEYPEERQVGVLKETLKEVQHRELCGLQHQQLCSTSLLSDVERNDTSATLHGECECEHLSISAYPRPASRGELPSSHAYSAPADNGEPLSRHTPLYHSP